jgi:hypothetical protein
MLPLLSDIAPRMDWPSFKSAHTFRGSPASDGPASSFQLEHTREVYQALAHRQPRLARSLDPSAVRTKKEVSAFIANAMAALHPRLGADA